jgi:dienelactone hydrolase
MSSTARRVAAALDRLGVERAIVVGHSSGGTFATALAEQRPDLVTAVVLIDTGPSMAAYIADEIAIGPAPWPDLTDDQLRQLLSSAFSADYEIPQPFVDEARGIDFHVFAATSQAVRAYLEEQALPERLASLGKPLLVIFGEDDRRWRSSSAAEYRAVPGATVEMLPGVGHSPNLEDPRGPPCPCWPSPVLLLLRLNQPVAGQHPMHRRPAGDASQPTLAKLEDDPAGPPPRVLPAQPQISASTSAASRAGLVLGRLERFTRPGMPLALNRLRQACTDYRVVPNRSATSPIGDPPSTSRTARYRYSASAC